ncbi:hypothetical protein P7K49_006845 [Saguinus oedipus]|uniref:CCDC144C-like coiled-coil domain-containing protein n=1 Tax=Saguinus oedipus TaxID=9490 RepID=A0ABQ9W3L4_SAGOE|nr:hypothetical protein P7K49_006845 [Saguinus oedipus]
MDKMKADMSDLQSRNEILSEKLSNAENETISLQIQLHNATDAQLDDAHKKVNRLEKTISTLHDQFQALASNIRSESEKQSLLLQENEELLD